MGKYVKIKKAKNLRFRLISILYLLFISLSIIQIPIEWLRINTTLASYFRSTTSNQYFSQEVKNAIDLIDELDSKFNERIGFDAKTKKYSEPTGYSATDKFFIKEKNADKLFEQLVILNKFFNNLPGNHPKKAEFNKLFAADLENGLGKNKPSIWIEWKIKHTPVAVVKAFLSEIRLRLILLNGAIELDTKRDKKDKILMVAYNIDVLKPGDTARFVISQKKETSLSITSLGKTVNDYFWKGDTLYFTPKLTGQYDISLSTKDLSEKLSITVIPAGFDSEQKETFQTFYEGKKSTLKFANVLQSSNVLCSCAESSSVSVANGKIEFTPSQSGWCEFKMLGKNGLPLLDDSIYIQSLPTPTIVVNGASNNKISSERLSLTHAVSISAIHPDMHNFNYDIGKVSYTLVGNGKANKTAQGASLELSNDEIVGLKYIIIKSVDIKTSVKDIVYKEPVLIEIIK